MYTAVHLRLSHVWINVKFYFGGGIFYEIEKALKVIKTKRFQVFVYPSGHVKYCRGINECFVAMFEFSRSDDGTIPFIEDIEKYKNLKVVEIIPYVSSVGIVVELNN